MNGKVMGEVQDTRYFGEWWGDRAYIASRFPVFVRSSKEYNVIENDKQLTLETRAAELRYKS